MPMPLATSMAGMRVLVCCMTVSPFIRIVDMFIVAKEGGGVKESRCVRVWKLLSPGIGK